VSLFEFVSLMDSEVLSPDCKMVNRMFIYSPSAAGEYGDVCQVPCPQPVHGGEPGCQQFPLQDGRLPRLVHIRGYAQLLRVPGVRQGELPNLQGHS